MVSLLVYLYLNFCC